jgi:hypothetical protein
MNVNVDQQTSARAEALAAANGRANHYYAVMAIVSAANFGLFALLLVFGAGLPSFARWMLVPYILSVTSFGALAGQAALEDVAAACRDYASENSGECARLMAAKPYGIFSALTVGFMVIIGLAQLALLFGL